MKKLRAPLSLLAVVAFAAAPLFAEDACCAHGKTAKKEFCSDYAKLNLNREQKAKLTALQDDCMKAGCTDESREKFLKGAKKFLSKDQYAQLKAECGRMARAEKKQG
jgi:hypothetical protein